MRFDRHADLSLTCNTLHVPHFLALGFAEVRRRGDVSDLVVLAVSRDLYAARCAMASRGIAFYGRSLVSRDDLPVVFAAAGGRHLEAYAGSNREPPPAHFLAAYPDSSEIPLSLPFYRLLGHALTALPDPRPWPLLMPTSGCAVPASFSSLP
jgi:hypothetical protein